MLTQHLNLIDLYPETNSKNKTIVTVYESDGANRNSKKERRIKSTAY